jgi:polyhydroxyalkanoate synthesis regulator phasin
MRHVELEDQMTTEKEEKSKGRSSLYEATRTLLLAAIGAASLAQDELSAFIDRLVERGEMAEADARKLVREVMERREKIERERRQQEQKASGATPITRADIEALTARIAELSRQIEELKKASEK